MRISKVRGLAAAVTTCVLLATGASAASAAPAAWNTTGGVAITPSGTFTIKVGATPDAHNIFTCSTITNIIADATTTAGQGYLSGFGFSSPTPQNGLCYDATGSFMLIDFVKMGLAMKGVKTGSAYSVQGLNEMYIHITGSYVNYTSDAVGAVSYTAPWTNGTSVANPSTVVFTNAQVGTTTTGSLPITLTGTFKLKTGGGGLLTLI
ncbi:MAG: hypothetical protein ABW167_02320 [Baekduia sp.]